jgi:hypothetical protein
MSTSHNLPQKGQSNGHDLNSTATLNYYFYVREN